MDYLNVFTIIGVLGAFVFFIHNRSERDLTKLADRIEREIGNLHSEVKENRTAIQNVESKLSAQIKNVESNVRKDIEKIGHRMIRIEDRIEFSNKVVYIKPEKEEQKEN